MNEKEILLLNDLLGEFIQDRVFRICNDINPAYYEHWSPEDIEQFRRDYHVFNGDWEEVKNDKAVFPLDFCALELLRHKLMLTII